ncbi:MAG: hypothetical protein Q8N06_10635 [Hydrogenophaga sp.]|nr:hypothetical protein [Hydrogenophaga sp.]MDP3419300.1 hypothetical protein [Thiobacillus sp.]
MSSEGEDQHAADGLDSIEARIVSAPEGLCQDAAAEVACCGIISGTYPLTSLALEATDCATCGADHRRC